jgi:hypothetical protein
MVVGGSGWWTAPDSVPADNPFRKNLEIMKETPGRFARMLGVPVVHAAHAGGFVGRSWPTEGSTYASHFLGEAQIVDGKGGILARMSREDGEGIISAEISFGPIAETPEPIPDRYWIADFSEQTYRQWESNLRTGNAYYFSSTLPYVRGRIEHAAEQHLP